MVIVMVEILIVGHRQRLLPRHVVVGGVVQVIRDDLDDLVAVVLAAKALAALVRINKFHPTPTLASLEPP